MGSVSAQGWVQRRSLPVGPALARLALSSEAQMAPIGS